LSTTNPTATRSQPNEKRPPCSTPRSPPTTSVIKAIAPMLMIFFVLQLGILDVPLGWYGLLDSRVILPIVLLAIAWELVCLGRRGANERFTRGRWRQCFEMVRCDALLWSERVDLRGGSRLLDSPAALNGAPVFGTFVAHAPAIDDALVEHARTVVPIAGEASLTRLPDVLVARWRGPASDAGHRYFAALWSALRRRLIGRDAVPPRIWST